MSIHNQDSGGELVAAKRKVDPDWPWNRTRSLADVGWPGADHPTRGPQPDRPAYREIRRREYEREWRIPYAGAES
jgi:hypothetical protein